MTVAVQNLSKHALLTEIEKTRSKMHYLTAKKHRTSEEVVEISTHLDKLLNQYQSMQLKNNSSLL
ncbi:aspartyl-phosphate phosphatase Spo0E family protein [Salipaludibacillus agaradhaerens]|jgi:hypothetical protein|uniref:Aspartyl-phosphate phosphatase Spo0E family protein n=1 Tax=Salipaludibacillus agaradhaerens TaxID=76935 RepID=A0A9Q4B4K4_SALAG|nr:aspartyl-phosphate phosphatase Spo0E family protein [Salipaludibacillus agaradhaerens]UJW56176.1 aspartyl-phosphate phosphatase Spo0E family protein [Bacillus sp. A116_S68]MCR6098214.1 aspartyl-phosphate phosphatase Spo0E family protein [Salipaludibacillus agaradhaerens]MCR6104933.1 aspartyl-phosphate phosphatase Spo0E family protein [Salipaludibacillus agaradhaerens]MCR6116156.1 aspartyl-phosphate phosphatase Spo0E family protein [Salipaludibacillus agaradhaerens]MCR6116980.1 aspartyl-phos